MKLLIILISGLLAFGPVWARTPDGMPPANEGVCDDLFDATPGLYGLCVAFCEAQDCVPDFTLANPFENCKFGSEKVLRNYEKRMGAGDPSMPCIQQSACPCWTLEELAGLRTVNQSDDAWGCFLNLDEPNSQLLNIDSWSIGEPTPGPMPQPPPDYLTRLTTIGSINAIAQSCALIDTCNDLNCLGVNRFLIINPEEHAACEADLLASAFERPPLDCVDLSPP